MKGIFRHVTEVCDCKCTCDLSLVEDSRKEKNLIFKFKVLSF